MLLPGSDAGSLQEAAAESEGMAAPQRARSVGRARVSSLVTDMGNMAPAVR